MKTTVLEEAEALMGISNYRKIPKSRLSHQHLPNQHWTEPAKGQAEAYTLLVTLATEF